MSKLEQSQPDDNCRSFFKERHKLRAEIATVSELYNLVLDSDSDIPFDYRAVSKNTANALRRNGIFTLNQLLNSTNTELRAFYGFGLKCFEEIDAYLKSGTLERSGMCRKRDQVCKSQALLQQKAVVLSGKRELITRDNLANLPDAVFSSIEEKYDLIDNDLINQCDTNTEAVKDIIVALDTYSCKATLNNRLRAALAAIPSYKENNTFMRYVRLFESENKVKVNDITIDEELILADVSKLFDESDVDQDMLLRILKWLSYDLKSEFDDVISRIKEKDTRIFEVLELRQNNTLQVVGEKIGVTRERIRQIESKGVAFFISWFNSCDLIGRIVSDYNGKVFVTYEDLASIFKEQTGLFVYLLGFCENDSFSMTNDNTLILCNKPILDKASKYIDSLPEIFEIEKYDYYLSQASNSGIASDLFIALFKKNYYQATTVYCRNGLAKYRMCEYIMRAFFPDGMQIYDEEELNCFRSYFYKEFKDVELPSNRGLTALIARFSVLCGRGRYIPKKEKYISNDLAHKISAFIDSNESPIMLVVTIFKRFENELKSFGINNQYYLHGVLKEVFESKYYFSRDYLSRDSKSISFYEEIENFIKKAGVPVSKQQLREAYPGITEIMIAFAVSDEKILNYYDSFIHVDNLNLYDEDIYYLKKVLVQGLEGDIPKPTYVFFDYIMSKNPDMLKRLGIYSQFSLYSLLDYLFGNDFEFSRPYIANKGILIDKPKELIEEYVHSNDIVDVNELFEMVNDYYANVMDKLKFLLSFNNTHLLVNKGQLVSIEFLGIKEDFVTQLERFILNELDGTKRIVSLKCINNIPKMKVSWDEWYIYSLIYKWGRLTEVGTTSNQFRYAKPIIAEKGKLSLDNLNDDLQSGEIGRVDDVDDFEAIADSVIDSIDWSEL